MCNMNPWIPKDENEEVFIQNRYEDTSLLLHQESKLKQNFNTNADLFQYGSTSRRSPYQTLSNGTLYLKQPNKETSTNVEITTVSLMNEKILRCVIM